MADLKARNIVGGQNFDPAFDQQGIPLCLSWTIEMVENWISNLGFPQYKVCLTVYV